MEDKDEGSIEAHRFGGPKGPQDRPPRGRRGHSRWAIAIALCVIAVGDGMYETTFGGRLPQLQDLLKVGAGEMGAVVGAFHAGLGIGCVTTSLFAGRIGTRPFLMGGAILCFAPLGAIGLLLDGLPAPELLAEMTLLWLASGIGLGLMTPAWVTQAVAFSRGGHAIQWIVACKLAGTTAGAALVAWANARGFSVQDHFVWVGAATLVACVTAAVIPPSIRKAPVDREAGPDVGFKGLVVLGLLLAVSIVPLAGAINWATSVLAELDAPPAFQAGGQVGFALASAAGMMGFFVLSRRRPPHTGPRRAVRGMVIAAVGILFLGVVAVERAYPFLAPSVAYGCVVTGFALLGLGVAAVPQLIQQALDNVRAGRVGVSARVGIAITIQYAFIGVAMAGIGWLAERLDVTRAFVIVIVVCLAALMAGRRWLRHAIAP